MAEKRLKRFSDLKGMSNDPESDIYINPFIDEDIPMNPNLPKKTKKVEVLPSRKNLIPKEQNNDMDNNMNENNIKTYGKVAKFPKNVRAHKAYNFLENVKISKKSIWYIMIESQDNELQMVKYNYNAGVNLSQFVIDLKEYYINKNKDNQRLCEVINNISVDGNDKYSRITNIPKITLDGLSLISILTEDLIKLLSK